MDFEITLSHPYVLVPLRGASIPVFIFFDDIKKKSLPDGFYRYYAKYKRGVVRHIMPHKDDSEIRPKDRVTVITMEEFPYKSSLGKHLHTIWANSYHVSHNEVPDHIKNRYGADGFERYKKAVLDANEKHKNRYNEAISKIQLN